MSNKNKLINKSYLYRQFHRYYNQIVKPAIVETDDNMIFLNAKLNRIINALESNGIQVDLSNLEPSSLFNEIYMSGENTVSIGNSINLTSNESGVTWTSSDDTKATVVDGVVTGVSVGKVTISASKNGFTNGIKYVTITE